MTPNAALTTEAANHQDPVLTKLEEVLTRLENVEANVEEMLEKLQEIAGNVDDFGFVIGEN